MKLFDKPILLVKRNIEPFELVTELNRKKLNQDEIEDLVRKCFKASDADSIDYVVFCQGNSAGKFELYDDTIRLYEFLCLETRLFDVNHEIFKKAYKRWDQRNRTHIKELIDSISSDERFILNSNIYDEKRGIVNFGIEMYDDALSDFHDVQDKIDYFLRELHKCDDIRPYEISDIECEDLDDNVTNFIIPVSIDNGIKTLDPYWKWQYGFKL